MKKNNLFRIVPFVALLLASCGGGNKEAQTEKPLPKVRVEAVKLAQVEQLSTFTATIQANAVNNIAPAMGGRIRRIHVDVGSNVRQGETLVVMDAATFSQQETQVATLQRDYQRYQELYAVGGISKQQLDQAKAQLDVAQSALNNLGENTSLRSPISGVVTARNYDAGDMVANMPILTVENINPVKVLVNISEKYYTQVIRGMEVKVRVDALGEEEFTGKVSLIHPTFDPVSHTFPVEIEVANNDRRIRPGMFSRVVMNFGVNERPLVSDMAVMKQVGSNDRYVFVERGGKAVYTLVELGVRVGDKYEIVSGLQPEDKVIVNGNTGLINGVAVEVVQ